MSNELHTDLSSAALAELVKRLAITLNLERVNPGSTPHPLSWAAMCYLHYGVLPA